MTPEGKVKEKVKAILDSYKPACWFCMPSSRAYGQAGVPDLIGSYMGRMFAVETKSGIRKPGALQMYQMNRIKEAGGVVFVIREDNLYELAEWLKAVQCAGLQKSS